MIRSLTLLNLEWGNLRAGRVERAAEVLAEALDVLASLRNHEGMARALEAIGALATHRRDPMPVTRAIEVARTVVQGGARIPSSR